ncbi:MAG: hypothetical protein RML35_15970 [Chloroherpetonaceae bacterium]|nr:hypothetical protein [Chloroherpetonaceae bacterium]
MDVPLIELRIDKRALKCFLDTGERLSCLLEEVTSNYQSVGTEEDFYFDRQISDKVLRDNHKSERKAFYREVCNLLASLQVTPKATGVKGIIGYDFFNNLKGILDLREESYA